MIPETRYAKTADGVHIAYQVRGEGPVDLVFVMGFVNHLEVAFEHPLQARLFDRLASFSRLILFDKRGTGLSDRDQTPDLDRRADDLRAVLDTVAPSEPSCSGKPRAERWSRSSLQRIPTACWDSSSTARAHGTRGLPTTRWA